MGRHGLRYAITLLGVAVLFFACLSPAFAASTSIIGSKHDFTDGGRISGGHFSGYWAIGAAADLGPLIDEVCVFCHTPHGASLEPTTNTLLWNRAPSPSPGIPAAYTYKAYSSTTMTNPAPDTGDRRPTGISMMCMSCHDGVTSIAVNMNNNPSTPTLLNAPGSNVNNQVSIDLFQPDMPFPGALGNVFNNGSLGWGANIGNAIPGVAGTIDLSNDHPISFEWPAGLTGYIYPPTNNALRLFGTGRRIECATCHRVHDPSIEPFLAMSNAQSMMCRSCHIK